MEVFNLISQECVTIINQKIVSNVTYWKNNYQKCMDVLNNINTILVRNNINCQEITHELNKISVVNDVLIPQVNLKFPDAKKKKPTPRQTQDIYKTLKESYNRTEIKSFNIIKSPNKEPNLNRLTTSEFVIKLKEYKKEIDSGDNIILKNAVHFGHWLQIGFEKFTASKIEGKILKGLTYNDFLQQKCDIKKTWALSMRNFYKVCAEYPQLLHCKMPLSFFLKNRTQIIKYFQQNVVLGQSWKHNITCRCRHCGPM